MEVFEIRQQIADHYKIRHQGRPNNGATVKQIKQYGIYWDVRPDNFRSLRDEKMTDRLVIICNECREDIND